MSSNIQIVVINASTVVSDDEVTKVAAALQRQVSEHFYPAWGIDAQLIPIPKGAASPTTSDAWQLIVLDDVDSAEYLGFHDLSKTGTPLGKIFAGTDKKIGEPWSVTASHELLEVIADPHINLTVFREDIGQLWAYETADACLTGNTKISLLNGSEVPIKDLVGKDHFWLYSALPGGSIHPGRGHSARVAKRDAEIIKVTLDNGESIRCTPDHKFMLRDGKYITAGQLKCGQSLMPLYRRRAPLERTNPLDYEQVFDLSEDCWKFTHRVVIPSVPYGHVRHHVDFNRFNNAPDNLLPMGFSAHRKLHQSKMREVGLLPQSIAAKRQNMLKLNASHKGKKRPELTGPKNVSAGARKATGERGRVLIALRIPNTPEQRRKAALNGKITLAKLWQDPDFRAAHSKRASKAMTAYNGSEKQKAGHAAYVNSERGKLMMKTLAHDRWHVKRNIINPNCPLCVKDKEPIVTNHKVVSVLPCGREDVYDLTVDGFHNFATSAGVFVHNCEATENAYDIDGVLVSDFVFPSWFEGFWKPEQTQFDFCKKIIAPFQLLTGGYIGYFDIANGLGWQQTFAQGARPLAKARPPVGSRRERRRTPKSQWLVSKK